MADHGLDEWINDVFNGSSKPSNDDWERNPMKTTIKTKSHKLSNRNKRCYNCHGMGHIATKCPSKGVYGRSRSTLKGNDRKTGRTPIHNQSGRVNYTKRKTETKCNNCTELQNENKQLKQQMHALEATILTLQQENASLQYLITEEQSQIAINTFKNDDEKTNTFPILLLTFDCQICLETHNIEAQHKISSCDHVFCRECLKNHALNYPKAQIPDCPLPNCHHKLSDYHDLQLLLSPTEYYKLHKKLNEIEISKIADLKHCQTPDCDYAVELIGGPRLDCRKCGSSWCTNCQTAWHSGLKCEEYQEQLVQQRIGHRVQRRDNEFAVWIQHNRHRVKTCPSCRNEVEKNEGCNHMTCRCGTHWCWICRAVLNPHNLQAHFSNAHPMIEDN